MRRGILFLAILVLMSSSCGRHRDERLLGRWVSLERAKGEIATVVEFRSGGSLVSSFETLIDYRYQLGNNVLLLTTIGSIPGEPPEQSFQVSLSGDRLVLTNLADNTEEHLKRSGPAPADASSLVGEWQSDPAGDQPLFMDFKSDGTLSLRRVIRSSQGRYTINGDSLTVTPEGQPSQQGTYRFEGDQLVMISADGQKIRYQRLE
jgi:hypothetical protein